MDVFDQLKAYVATARSGSFAAAGDELNISPRVPAKQVRELEKRLGVRLFQRTTRVAGLTPIGEKLLPRAAQLFDDFADFIADATETTNDMRGRLRISAPIAFGESYVVGLLGRFSSHYPDMTIDLDLSDNNTDLSSKGIDLAFIAGRVDPRFLKSQPFGKFCFGVFASPSYIKASGTPHSIDDLSMHTCIGDTSRHSARRWYYSKNGVGKSVTVKLGVRVNSVRSILGFAADGHGLALVPEFAVNDRVRSGELVRVLQHINWESQTISLAHESSRSISPQLHALINFSFEDAKEHLNNNQITEPHSGND
ncbi:MAG: LysR family transcriptional regulator [Pseudomonadota bacterium]|nr:LysR family transcriptional regulator [Pseudomonadota bacterium]